MPEHICLDCGEPVVREARRGRPSTYCARCRAVRRRNREQASWRRRAIRLGCAERRPHPCAFCGVETSRPKYCCEKCNSADKYRRNVASGAESAKIARRRDKYASRALPPEQRSCIWCGADYLAEWRTRKAIYCGFLCRKSASEARARSRERVARRLFEAGALTPRGPRVVDCEINWIGGLWVHCPRCRMLTGCPTSDVVDRWCAPCDIHFVVNREEVDLAFAGWLAA